MLLGPIVFLFSDCYQGANLQLTFYDLNWSVGFILISGGTIVFLKVANKCFGLNFTIEEHCVDSLCPLRNCDEGEFTNVFCGVPKIKAGEQILSCMKPCALDISTVHWTKTDFFKRVSSDL